MRTANNEEFIIDNFRDASTKEIILLGDFFDCIKIRRSLTNFFQRKKWINSSAKNVPPPDFYNDKLKLMMEVMRIDDNAYVDEKGRQQNPIYKKEEEILRKYFGNNYKKERDDISCFVVASTDLPTNQDHNFKRYFDNFKRVFEKHNKKIDNYKKNHPGYKTIFFVFDESTAYIEAIDKEYVRENPKKGEMSCGKPHFACFDKRFLDVIINSEVDYVIWCMPYKLITGINGKMFPLPKVAIIERAKIPQEAFQIYNSDLMMSSEE